MTSSHVDEVMSPPRRRFRLGVLGISHETNTFCLTPTTLSDFEREGILRGDEIWRVHAGAHTIAAGFATAGRQPDVELVPLILASANPGGTISRNTFETLIGELVTLVHANGPWDGLLMAQHGAAVADGYPDADGEIISRIRGAVGPDRPIGVVLDMHANISAKMIDASTITVVFRTNPHVDPRDRGAECADLVVRAMRGTIRPAQALIPIPAVINITRQSTAESPMQEIMTAVKRVASRRDVLSVSVAEGFPYADVEEMGMTCLVVADGNPRAAQRSAEWLAERVWGSREGFLERAMTPEQALIAAEAHAEQAGRPALVLDVGDNIGGGGPGDSTVLLEAIQRMAIRRALVIITDRDAVASCVDAGPGGSVRMPIGGKIDGRFCAPVEIRGIVRVLSDGRYEEPTPTHGGYRYFDAGTTASVETTQGHTVVLTSRAVMPSSLEQVRSLGIDPERFTILTAKGVISPRAGYEPATCGTYVADSPGVSAAGLERFSYERRRRPLFPFER